MAHRAFLGLTSPANVGGLAMGIGGQFRDGEAVEAQAALDEAIGAQGAVVAFLAA